jgi:hypothetical protein
VITVVNASTRVTNDQVSLMTRACWTQVQRDAGPAWRLQPMPVVFSTDPKTAPPGSWLITVFDTPDQANALGYHDVTNGDVIYGKVFAGPVLDNGGDALSKPLSVASVLSHEVLETFVDPYCNVWHDTLRGYSIAREVGDPVESDSYPVMVDSYQITVSNFVTERWFDPFAKGGRFDFMGRVSKPFTMTSGGYLILMKDGKVSQTFGEHFPSWKRAGKEFPIARTARRVEQQQRTPLIDKILDVVAE